MLAKLGTETLLVEFSDKFNCWSPSPTFYLLFWVGESHFLVKSIYNSTTSQAMVAKFGTEVLLVEFLKKFHCGSS